MEIIPRLLEFWSPPPKKKKMAATFVLRFAADEI